MEARPPPIPCHAASRLARAPGHPVGETVLDHLAQSPARWPSRPRSAPKLVDLTALARSRQAAFWCNKRCRSALRDKRMQQLLRRKWLGQIIESAGLDGLGDRQLRCGIGGDHQNRQVWPADMHLAQQLVSAHARSQTGVGDDHEIFLLRQQIQGTSSADSAACTAYPSSASTVRNERRMFFSSSTISTGGKAAFMALSL